LESGANATARDVATLSRVLQRVTAEEKRDPHEKRQIAEYLQSAIALLVRWTEPVETNGGARKEKSRLKSEATR
jgi:hypothetical protein